MNVGLFIPCYVDQFYPQVAIATLELLEKQGCNVHFPPNQTCCGQPMANSGFEHLTGGCNELFAKNFAGFDYIVCPSGSCTLHIKEHLGVPEIASRCYELTEFLTDILHIKSLPSYFPYKVGLHQSCHGQRGLKLSQMSELNAPHFSKAEQLLSQVEGLELVTLQRRDECCGFGGTFCVSEEALSVRMGQDRVMDHVHSGTQVLTAGDMSCLMHLEGIIRREKLPIRVMHLAEILNGVAVELDAAKK
ncbi:(Fe-S)-binding protein [Arundinibacter roseus]|uniref:(Fe-S)-binding protein n=1 Tax=Arundinibacter roseus TaxID=2070510 RepID=A0A4V2X8X1_9BACT|nr:(Fe-S)-binding protein [Arundinibacter roseus]TDB61425.1 (Fe-S)-binding protein [Arundinibacter roseus]